METCSYSREYNSEQLSSSPSSSEKGVESDDGQLETVMEKEKSTGKPGHKVVNFPPKLPFSRPPNKPRRLTNQLEFWKTQIQNMWNNESAEPFWYPVDPNLAPNYYDEIKHPMDLNTIWQRLVKDYYSSAKELETDFRVMLDNCFKYNIFGDPVYMQGKVIEKAFMEVLEQMPKVEEEIQQKVQNRAARRKQRKKTASRRRNPGTSVEITVPLLAPESTNVSSECALVAAAASEQEGQVEIFPAATASLFSIGADGMLSPWLPPYVDSSAGSLSMLSATSNEAFKPTISAGVSATSPEKLALPWKLAQKSYPTADSSECHYVSEVGPSHIPSSAVVTGSYDAGDGWNMQKSGELETSPSMEACVNLLKELQDEHAELFKVFWNADNFAKTDGIERVRKPMDLRRIQAMMSNGEYKTAATFEKDMRLIFKNCLITHHVEDVLSLNDDHIIKQANDLRFHFDYKFSKIPNDDQEGAGVHFTESNGDISDSLGSKYFLQKALQKMEEARTYSAKAIAVQRAEKMLQKEEPQRKPQPRRKVTSSPHQSVSTTTPDDQMLAKRSRKVVRTSNRKLDTPVVKKSRSEGKRVVQKKVRVTKPSATAIAPTGEQVSRTHERPADIVSTLPLTAEENCQLYRDINKLMDFTGYEEKVADVVKGESKFSEEGKVVLDLDALTASTARLLKSKVKSWLNQCPCSSSSSSASSESE